MNAFILKVVLYLAILVVAHAPISLSLSLSHISELSILWQLFRKDSVQMQNAKARLWEERVEQEPSRQVSHEIVSLGYGDMLKCRQGIILRTSFGRQSHPSFFKPIGTRASPIRPTIWSQQNHWLLLVVTLGSTPFCARLHRPQCLQNLSLNYFRLPTHVPLWV